MIQIENWLKSRGLTIRDPNDTREMYVFNQVALKIRNDGLFGGYLLG